MGLRSLSHLQCLIRELCPHWRNISIKTCGKYLGFVVGPGAVDSSWDNPSQKYLERARQWSSLKLGLFLNSQCYKIFVVSVLSYIMQLADDPRELSEQYAKALRLLAPGPGNWITTSDAAHLEKFYSFPGSFPDPQWLSLACKLRVISEVASDCKQKADELEKAHVTFRCRPFPEWHKRCYFNILANCAAKLSHVGITALSVARKVEELEHARSFQSVAVDLITERFGKPYFPNARIRQKLVSWRLYGIPAHLENRILRNFALLRRWCHPRILTVYFRSIWGGWVTDERMKSLIAKTGGKCRSCVLGCGYEQDMVEHYGRCRVYWEFLSQPLGTGLGLPVALRSGETFLWLSENSDEDKVRLALGMYALYRTVQTLRHAEGNAQLDCKKLMKIWIKKAAQRSKASALLQY